MALSGGMLRRSAGSTNLIPNSRSIGVVEKSDLIKMSFEASKKKSRLESLRDNYRSRLQSQNDAIVHLVKNNPQLVDRIMKGQGSAGPSDRRAESEQIQRRVSQLRDHIDVKPEKTISITSSGFHVSQGYNSLLSDPVTKSHDPQSAGRLSTSASPYIHASNALSKEYISKRHNTTELGPPDKHKQKQAIERLDWELNFSLRHIRERAQRKREYLLNHPLPSIPQSPFRIDEPSEDLNEVFSISSSLLTVDDVPPISLKPTLVRRHRLLQPIEHNETNSLKQNRSKPKPLTKTYNNSLIRALEKVNEERESSDVTPLNELPESGEMIVAETDETTEDDRAMSVGSLNEYEKRCVRLDTAKLREIRERKRREQAQLRREQSNIEVNSDTTPVHLPLTALRKDLERKAKTEPNTKSPIPGEDVLVNQPVSFTPPEIQFHDRAKDDLAKKTVFSQSNDIISKLIPAEDVVWGKKPQTQLSEEDKRKFFRSRSLSSRTIESLEINSFRTDDEHFVNHRSSPEESNYVHESGNNSSSPRTVTELPSELTSDQTLMDISDRSSNLDQPTKNLKHLSRESSHNSTSSDKTNQHENEIKTSKYPNNNQPLQSQQFGSSAKKRKTVNQKPTLPSKTQVVINEDPYFAKIAEDAEVIVVDLMECDRCMRKFAMDRIEKHMKLCSLGITRKPYSAQKHRIRGTEMEKFANYSDKEPPPGPRYRSRSQSGSDYNQQNVPRPLATTTVVCPNCKKTFSIQGFERHSQYCKEHSFKKSNRQQQQQKKEQNFIMR